MATGSTTTITGLKTGMTVSIVPNKRTANRVNLFVLKGCNLPV